MKRHPWAAPDHGDQARFPPQDVFAAGERNHHISNTSYPIAHSRVWKPYRVPRRSHRETVSAAFAGIDSLCLYTHIPFCETRCAYCEYTVVGRDELGSVRVYMEALRRELESYRELLGTRERSLEGFDIGGGTPSFVPLELLAPHVEQVRRSFRIRPEMEISIETTPKIASENPERIAGYRELGIHRISMGVQVTQPDLLKVLNRSRDGISVQLRAVEHIREAGFEKFNLDLMYGFAGQSVESWRATLEHAIRLDPEYITLYRMRYKLTRISDQASRVELATVREQASLAKKMLADAGYIANPGKNTYSRISGDIGTSDYLTRRVIQGIPYLGIGLGAQTFTDTTISYNDGAAGKELRPYLKSIEREELPIQDLYHLPLAHMAAKMCAVSFYFGEVDLAAFREKFGVPFEAVYQDEIDFLLEQGLMSYSGRGHVRPRLVSDEPAFSLTELGARHFNGVIALFFAPSVKEYLVERNPDRAEDMHRNRRDALKVWDGEQAYE